MLSLLRQSSVVGGSLYAPGAGIGIDEQRDPPVGAETILPARRARRTPAIEDALCMVAAKRGTLLSALPVGQGKKGSQ